MFTSEFPWEWDGVRLDTLAYNIETLTGRYTTAGVRSESEILPGVDGEVVSWFDDYTSRDIQFSMWVRGADLDGVIPADGTEARGLFDKNFSILSLIANKRS